MRYQHPRYLFRRYEIMRRVRRGKHFLEIGPGNLALAQELLAKFDVGTLVDFNTTDVQAIYDALPKRYRGRLELVIADFAEYHGIGQQFDCVAICEVLEHIEDDERFLQKINQVLNPAGQLILSVPARQQYWSTDDEIVGHYRRYEKQELYDKLKRAGFADIEVASYGFPFENLVRFARITLAKLQYREKAGWDHKKQSQQSAFLVKRSLFTDLIAILLNKYTLYPFSLFASLFNTMDLADGYVVSARRGSAHD